MYRHMRTKELMDAAIRDMVALEGAVLDFAALDKGSRAPSDLTYLVDNDLDQDIDVQIIGGVYDSSIPAWVFKIDIGDPVTVAADTLATIDVFPGNHYHPAYGVEVTAQVNPTVDSCLIRAEYVIDQ